MQPSCLLPCAFLLATVACGDLDTGTGDGSPPGTAADFVLLHDERALAGTAFLIDVITTEPALGREAMNAAFAEIDRLESVVSEWNPASELSAVNSAAGRMPVRVSAELYGILNRSLWISELTKGAFDVSFAACAGLWSVPGRRVPSPDALAQCRRRTGYRRIRLDPQQPAVSLPMAGMQLGLGAIAKGYRVDRAAEVLESFGISSYVVNGGGDIRLSTGESRPPWTVEIAHPREPGKALGTVRLRRGAIVTSGDSSWFFDQAGLRQHHIIDPRTGAPARGLVAVTVIASSAMDADALATGLFVLGPERSLELLRRLPGYEALLVDPALEVHLSDGFPPLVESLPGAS